MTSVYYAGKPDAGLTRSSGLEEPGRKRVSAMRLRAALPSYTRTVTSMKKERRTAALLFGLVNNSKSPLARGKKNRSFSGQI